MGRAVEKLNVFPEIFKLIPLIPTIATELSSDELLYKGIEELMLPVGLYGQGCYLYLLTREPRQEGGTLWLIHQIDPGKERIIGQFELPTSINHLTIVPTSKNWYIFERGPVLPGSQQKIESMLVIPSSLIQSRLVPKSCQSLTSTRQKPDWIQAPGCEIGARVFCVGWDARSRG